MLSLHASTMMEIEMPVVTGLPVDKAEKILCHKGLAIKRLYYASGEGEDGWVLRQRPEPGQTLSSADAVELTVNRRSLMAYLPEVMKREDLRAGSLMERLLWVVEHLWSAFETQVDRLPDFFNPHLTPAKGLPYLASVLGAELETDWPEEAQRVFLTRVAGLFQGRGTRGGLIRMVETVTGVPATVEEHRFPFTPLVLDGRTFLDGKTALFEVPQLEHCFTVRLQGASGDFSPRILSRIHRLLQTEKPAHTQYFLAFEEKQATYAELLPWVLGVGVLGEESCLTAA